MSVCGACLEGSCVVFVTDTDCALFIADTGCAIFIADLKCAIFVADLGNAMFIADLVCVVFVTIIGGSCHKYFCRNRSFVATKMILVAAPANDT